MPIKTKVIVSVFFLISNSVAAQNINDVTTPLHLLQPEYPTPYGKPEVKDIVETLDKVYDYLNAVTPAKLEDKNTGKELSDFSKVDENTILAQGDFRLNSYEWGVTYAGMLLATEMTGNPKYAAYTFDRVNFLGEALEAFSVFETNNPGKEHALWHTLHPHALDDCGALCAAMIKAAKEREVKNLDKIINIQIDYISNKQFRLKDNTLARNRPQPNSLWLDDLFMSVPALAQMGSYSGDNKHFDDAVKQVLQFSKRMFNYEKGLYMHGWIQEMESNDFYRPNFDEDRKDPFGNKKLFETAENLIS